MVLSDCLLVLYSGVNLNGKPTRSIALDELEGPRFGGNFWWAKCSWIGGLRVPYDGFVASDPSAWEGGADSRSDVGQESGDAKSCEAAQRRGGECGRLSGEEATRARKAESELWLGSAPDFRPKDLWNSELDHYAHNYPPSAYEGALRYVIARKECAAV